MSSVRSSVRQQQYSSRKSNTSSAKIGSISTSTSANRPNSRNSTASSGEDTSSLKNWVLHYSPPHTVELGFSRVNVLLVGGVGSCKSSFINAVVTALEDDDQVHFRAPVSAVDQYSLDARTGPSTGTTSVFERYDVTPNIVLWDTWSWNSDSERTHSAMLDGRLPSGWPSDKEIPAHDAGAYVNFPYAMHAAICFVPSTSVLDADDYLAKAKQFTDAARARGIQAMVVLSQCDKIDSDVSDDPAAVYRSEAVETARATAASLLSVPLNTVFACKTYFSEFARQRSIDHLVLTALKGALCNANELMRRRYNQQFQQYSGPQDFRTIDVAPATSDDSMSLLTKLPLLDRVRDRLSSFRRNRVQQIRQWRELLDRRKYSIPRRAEYLSRVKANLIYLGSNYLIVLLVAIFLFCLFHIAQKPFMVLWCAVIAVLWYWAFRINRGSIRLGRVVIPLAVKQIIFALVMLSVSVTVVLEFGPLVLWTVVAVAPIVFLHASFYIPSSFTDRKKQNL